MTEARVNQNITGQVSYTHPSSNSQSPARAVRYLTRRPQGHEATREADWETLPPEQLLGDPQAFKAEANERRRYWQEKAESEGKDLARIKNTPRCSSYIHVVVSPARREEYTDEDFAQLAEPWITNKDGTEAPWFAAIHRDADHGPHMHVLAARDKVERKHELPERRAESEALMDGVDETLDEQREARMELEESERQRREAERRERREQERREQRHGEEEDDDLSH